MKMLIHRRVAAVPALLLLLAGCSVRQDVYLSISGAGTAEGEIGLHRVFISYLEDLAMVFWGN